MLVVETWLPLVFLYGLLVAGLAFWGAAMWTPAIVLFTVGGVWSGWLLKTGEEEKGDEEDTDG